MLNPIIRSRLKLTVAIIIILTIILYVPIDIIYAAKSAKEFDVINPWAAFIAIITTIGLVGSYYINKETQRSSLLSNVFNFSTDEENTSKKVLSEEDESDPHEMPL